MPFSEPPHHVPSRPPAMHTLLHTALVVLTTTSLHAASHRYRLSWTDDPATTMTIGWCQQSGSPIGIEYATTRDFANARLTETITTHRYDNTRQRGNGPALSNHFVTLTGLQADTAYHFRVVDSEGRGARSWFKTAPDQPGPITFVAGGDSRSNPKPRQVGNILVSRVRPLFIAHGGDYENTCSNAEMANWLDEWQLTRSRDGRMYPVIPTHGNHENDVTDFVTRIFNAPNPDGYYGITIARMLRFYLLNTELEPYVGYGAYLDMTIADRHQRWLAQKVWLARDLQTHAATVPWNMAIYHRPMRPHQSRKAEGLGRIAAWAGLFLDHGVDLVIESDSHLCKYTYPIVPSDAPHAYESFVRDDARGTMYIGEGSWGAPHRANDDDKPWTLDSGEFWQFKLIHVDPTQTAIRTVKFGRKDAPFDPATVRELSQAEQDADPFAIPDGLDLWQTKRGTVITLPFHEQGTHR